MLTNITINAKKGKVEELKALLVTMVKPSQLEHGCMHYQILQSSTEPGNFQVFEAWATADDLEAHKATAHFLNFKANYSELIANKSVDILKYI